MIEVFDVLWEAERVVVAQPQEEKAQEGPHQCYKLWTAVWEIEPESSQRLH